MNGDYLIFDILSPVGCNIRGHFYHWCYICSKHPEIADLLDLLKMAISEPELIARSKADPKVYLCYLRHRE